MSDSVRARSLSFFPDGTYCHFDGKKDYYCLNRECKVEGARGSRSKNDVNYAQVPPDATIPDEVKKYFSLDEDFKNTKPRKPPVISRDYINKVIEDEEKKKTEKEEEEPKDYIELSDDKN